MKYRLLLFAAALLALARAASSQTTTTQPDGVLFPTQDSGRINGVRLQVQPDGSVWFLEATSDSIAYLKDGVIKRWQIRTNEQIGANPVDFQIEGNLVWFIESGQSQIDGGTCAYARLDTTTGQLTEWVIPGTIPAAFYRGPDGIVWFPQSGAVMQSFNPDTLEVVNWRSPATYAYADLTVAPDGSFWLADFGNNRIVHWVPGAPTETSWNFFPLTGGRLNPAQVELDENGWLWIVQRSANRVDHFDPFTNTLFSYTGITNPIHMDRFQNRVYVTSVLTTSSISVIDPAIAPPSGALELSPVTYDVGSSGVVRPVTIRNTVIVPTEFTSAPVTITPAQFAVTNPNPTSGHPHDDVPLGQYLRHHRGRRPRVGRDRRESRLAEHAGHRQRDRPRRARRVEPGRPGELEDRDQPHAGRSRHRGDHRPVALPLLPRRLCAADDLHAQPGRDVALGRQLRQHRDPVRQRARSGWAAPTAPRPISTPTCARRGPRRRAARSATCCRRLRS